MPDRISLASWLLPSGSWLPPSPFSIPKAVAYSLAYSVATCQVKTGMECLGWFGCLGGLAKIVAQGWNRDPWFFSIEIVICILPFETGSTV